MIVQIVRFKSELAEELILEMYNKRAPQYREIKGLKQKYYLRYSETGEYGAVYMWENESSINAFRESDLGKTISAMYKIQGNPEVLKADLVMTLYNGEGHK